MATLKDLPTGFAGSFAVDISKFKVKSLAQADVVRRKTCLDLFARVIMRSPVDTGRFRGNWQTAVGPQPQGLIDATDPGDVNQAGAGFATSKAGIQMIAALAERAPDKDIWLANNLPYAIPLEYGHSQQAPSGIVRLSMAEVPGIVEQAAKDVGRAL